MACTVAPNNESNSEPSKPAMVTHKKIDQSLPVGDSNAASIPMIPAPASDASVPTGEIPPDVPFSTALRKSVINLGEVGFSTPNSVAQVSALTAASEAANPSQGQVASGKTKCSAANRVAIPPLPNT